MSTFERHIQLEGIVFEIVTSYAAVILVFGCLKDSVASIRIIDCIDQAQQVLESIVFCGYRGSSTCWKSEPIGLNRTLRSVHDLKPKYF